MSERDDGFHGQVYADTYDPRDRPFPPDDLSPDDTLEDAENHLRALLRQDVPIAAQHTATNYRKLADPTWYQRGEECVGFALAAIADYHLRKDVADRWHELTAGERAERTVSRRMMYEMAQVYDRADYDEGSTLRGALKGWRKSGVAREVEWPYESGDEHGEKHGRLSLRRVIDAVRRPGSLYLRIDAHDVTSMKRSLLLDHPLFVSAKTHVGWINLYLPDQRVINQPHGGKNLGGHAFVIVGYDERGWVIHNSWGQEWGDQGYALLPYEDFEANAQDVWFVHTSKYVRQVHVSESALLRAAIDPQLDVDDDDDDDDVADETSGDDVEQPADGGGALATPTPPALAPRPGDVAPAGDVRPATYSRMWRHVVTIGDDGLFAPLGTSFGMNFDSLKTMLFLFRQQTAGWSTRRLAIIADGGYFSTGATIDALAPLRDELVANEIYPLFLLWDTAWFADMQGRLYADAGLDEHAVGHDLEWYYDRVGGAPMAKFLAAAYSIPTMWNQIRRRAEAACARRDGAARLLAKSIEYNLTKNPFEIHLIGHGVGDLLLSQFAQLVPAPIRTCTLLGPVTTMESFRNSYRALLDGNRMEQLSIVALDDEAERGDSTGPVPGSLALLVSDVLEAHGIDVLTALEKHDGHLVWQPSPEPVLGLQRFLSLDADVARLRGADKLDVTIVPASSHTGLLHDRAVRAATITDIRATAFKPALEPPRSPAAATSHHHPCVGVDPLVQLGTADPLASPPLL